MLRGLSNVRRRVEQLATRARTGRCDRDHQRIRIVTVQGNEPVPPWPEAGADERCVCGTPLKHLLIVNEIRQEGGASDHQ